MSSFTINPFTQRKIEVGGLTHQLVQKILAGPGTTEQKKQKYILESHSNKKPKYPQVAEQFFCGPAGGYPKGTFPVDTEKRCRAALSYSRYAPNPQAIRDCALNIATEQGWNCGKYSTAGQVKPKPKTKAKAKAKSKAKKNKTL
jgi:hypothetical protein